MSSPLQLPSPCASDSDTTPPRHTKTPSGVRMIKIQSLLNPQGSTSIGYRRDDVSVSPPPTPAYTTQASSKASTPSPHTLYAPPPDTKRKKLTKDAPVFVRGEAKGAINYPPYECTEKHPSLTLADRTALLEYHRAFDIFPSGRDGEQLIGDYVRRIPYSSEKKTFFGKTGREAFDVYQYTFKVPGDSEGKIHTVMWDYTIGLVRITPFFKSCKYSKTAPAKAIQNTPGLRDLSHSITGGALVAQGYWMPYACARALCISFCHPIRWALTPIFGPSFIHDCLVPTHPDFGRFKINHEIVRISALHCEGWREQSLAWSRSVTPIQETNGHHSAAPATIPRSEPSTTEAGKSLRTRNEKPRFKLGSPFSTDSSDAEGNYCDRSTMSPHLSPKSKPATSGWASINKAPSPPGNTPTRSLSRSLLPEPRHSRPANQTSWRSAVPRIVRMPTGAHDKRRPPKRVVDDDEDEYVSVSSSDGPDTQPSRGKSKRQRRADTPAPEAGISLKYSATEARAAQWLLNLSVRDAELASGPGGVVRQQ